jgi:aspartate aminotransferase-like enzyme
LLAEAYKNEGLRKLCKRHKALARFHEALAKAHQKAALTHEKIATPQVVAE